MPMTLWLKAGLMCPWKKFNCGRGVDQDDTDFLYLSFGFSNYDRRHIYVAIAAG